MISSEPVLQVVRPRHFPVASLSVMSFLLFQARLQVPHCCSQSLLPED
jgi:hypothetical protein